MNTNVSTTTHTSCDEINTTCITDLYAACIVSIQGADIFLTINDGYARMLPLWTKLYMDGTNAN